MVIEIFAKIFPTKFTALRIFYIWRPVHATHLSILFTLGTRVVPPTRTISSISLVAIPNTHILVILLSALNLFDATHLILTAV
jgi:hypothetical protein